MKRKHIDYFDFLRGLAIIFVVFNHSYSADPMSDGLIDMIYLLIRQDVTTNYGHGICWLLHRCV